MRTLLLLFTLLVTPILQAQNIEGSWSVNDSQTEKETSILSASDNIHLEGDTFFIRAKDSLIAQGIFEW